MEINKGFKKISHGALVHFSIDLVGGPKNIQEFISELASDIRIETISSVYKRFMSENHADLNARMEFVAKIETALEPDLMLHKMHSTSVKVDILLLAFDNLIKMSPQMTLPLPQLHTDSLIIRCAAEAWGNYEHPIYQKTLSELSRNAQPSLAAEFFLQGRSLIDI